MLIQATCEMVRAFNRFLNHTYPKTVAEMPAAAARNLIEGKPRVATNHPTRAAHPSSTDPRAAIRRRNRRPHRHPRHIGTLTLAANGAYTYSVANSAAQFLNDGQIKIDTFTVTAADGTTKQVAFNVHGINDLPVAQPDNGQVIEEGTKFNVDVPQLGNPFAGGNVVLNDTDADAGNLLTVTNVATSNTSIAVPLLNAVDIAGNYGTLTIGPSGLDGG